MALHTSAGSLQRTCGCELRPGGRWSSSGERMTPTTGGAETGERGPYPWFCERDCPSGVETLRRLRANGDGASEIYSAFM